MVDINLLGEEEPQEPGSSGRDFEPYRFEEPSAASEPSSSAAWTPGAPEGGFEEDLHKRRSWAPWLIFFLFAAITLVVVFLVWKPFRHRPVPVPVPATEAVVDTTTTRAAEPVVANTLAQRIDDLLTGLPTGSTLRSLSYTTGKFYLELDGGGEADVQAYADRLKGMLAEGNVGVRRRGGRVLLVGSLETPESSAQLVGLRPTTSDSLQGLLRQSAQSAGLKVVRLSSVRGTKLEDTLHTPFQLIMEGKLSGAQEFLHQLEDSGAAVQLTKLVITPLGGSAVRVVVHLDLLESS